jgi:hypothetical protein
LKLWVDKKEMFFKQKIPDVDVNGENGLFNILITEFYDETGMFEDKNIDVGYNDNKQGVNVSN